MRAERTTRMSEGPEKMRRQRTVLELIREATIPNQQALVRALRQRGFAVTQATLSRDLKELRILRVPGEQGYRYVRAGEAAASAEPGGSRLRAVAAMEVLRVEANEVGVVVRTLLGRAQGVGVYIDGLRNRDILGTIAGDDTILVLPRTVRRTAHVKRTLAELFGVD